MPHLECWLVNGFLASSDGQVKCAVRPSRMCEHHHSFSRGSIVPNRMLFSVKSGTLASNVQSDDLGRRHLQFLVDTGLQVLVEQRLELFVLLIQKTGLLDEVLSIDEKLIVLAQGFVEGLPDGELLIGKDFGHVRPVHLLFLLLSASVARFVCRLCIFRLFILLLVHQVFPQIAFVPRLVEMLQRRR